MFYIQFLYRGEWFSYTDDNTSVSFPYGKAIAVAEDYYHYHGETTQVIDSDGLVYAQYGLTQDDECEPVNDCCCFDCD
jgi:hypothetical protein